MSEEIPKLNTAMPGETPDHLRQRLLSGNINKDQFFQNVTNNTPKVPGVPGFLVKNVIGKAEKNPTPWLDKLKNVNPEKINNVIKINPEAFKGVDNNSVASNIKLSYNLKDMHTLKTFLAKQAASKNRPGLWANIRAKRARGGKPAKPGDEAYPDKENWKKLTAKNAGLADGHSLPKPIANPMDADQAMVGQFSSPNPEPLPVAKPTPFPTPKPTPHYPASQSAEGPGTTDPTPSHKDILKSIYNNNTAPVQPAPTPKLGMYLKALEKLSENVVMHKEDKNPTGGLTQKGRDKYNRATGGNLKAPVTEKNPKGKAKARKASFCARMSGVKGPMKDENGKPTRKALALRKWNCN